MLRPALWTVALIFPPILCEAADLSTYLGGSIGQDVEIEAADDVGAESSDPSLKVFGGVGIGEYFAAEIAYHDFGTTTCCGPSYADFGFERNGDAFSASAVALWPIKRFRLFAKAGALWWDVDGHDLTIEGPRPYSNDGVDLVAGAGCDIAVVSGLRIRLEWEHLKIDDDDADSVFNRSSVAVLIAQAKIANPYISPGFVARTARCRSQRGFRPEGRGARTRQYVEHPEARKHRWDRCIAGRSRKLVRYAG